MDECPRELKVWLIEKVILAAIPPDAAYDYSLEPADAQLERLKIPPQLERQADLDEALGMPLNRRAMAASANG